MSRAVAIGVIRLLATLVFAIGLSVVLGYALRMQWLITWGRDSHVALPTASGFMLVGAALMLVASVLRMGTDAAHDIASGSVAAVALLVFIGLLMAWLVVSVVHASMVSPSASSDVAALAVDMLNRYPLPHPR